ncbi:ABC transporter substrate-binding protein [Haloplanus litoreus]|uniref:ABC transporter substrate-binding protein n=1 Tax=Haloplanus litoreus TaxID=767515 RepID=A0ABD5ZYY8_9EURY
MVHDIGRREFLVGTGTAGTVGLAGCIGGDGGGGGDGGDGSGGGDGGDGSPEMLVVIGYPESGIQLFRNYYSMASGERDVLVPDGLRDGAMPGQVGNDMANVIGTAPAAGGPNQSAFNQLFQDQYGSSPGVFTSQSYDSVAIQILANAAAGENDGTAVRDQMRRIANPGGTEYGPQDFLDAVEAAANGEDINYQGASSATNFNSAGDPASAAYSIWEFQGADTEGTTQIEVQNFESENPEGGGPSADGGPGGMGRTIDVGILLPETGDLASVGGPMIQAAQLPARQVNDSDLDLEVNAQVEDTQTSPSSGVSAAESLVNAGMPSVCGSASSGVNVPVSQEVFIPNQIVGCSPSSTALSVTNLEDDDYIFRTAPSDQLQGRVMAQVASERLGNSTAATLYVNNDYGQQLSERFTEVFENTFDGTVTDQVAFNIGESSYTSVIETALSG